MVVIAIDLLAIFAMLTLRRHPRQLLFPLLKLGWADLPQKRMLAARIVEAFDEPEDLAGGLTARQEVLMMYQLRLQGREERLPTALSQQSPLGLMLQVMRYCQML